MKKLFIIFALIAILATGCDANEQWKLVSGTGDSADPTPLVFEGGVVLSGWGVTVPDYNGPAELHFHVAPEDPELLPQNIDFSRYDWNFKLENPDQEFVKVLIKSSPKNQVEIVTDKLTIPQEGHPIFHLVESPVQ